jgi:integrase/recombinase XerD
MSFEEAKTLKTESVWNQLSQISVEEGIQLWLENFKNPTRKNYLSGMNKLIELALIDPTISLQAFSLINHESIIDKIKLVNHWEEASKQARAACYISFTRFLSRRTKGIVPRAIPAKEGKEKTFYRTSEKVKTEAMSRAQWTKFLSKLAEINHRDWLIAQTMLQGGKRMSEVLSLTVDQVDFNQSRIKFRQSKTRGFEKDIFISYPKNFMEMLHKYVGDRKQGVFVTRGGFLVKPTQIQNTFAKAGVAADIPFKVTPHVLRASLVTYLKKQEFSDTDIMKITGHASAEMIAMYDKSSQEDNISKNLSLI